MLMTFSIEKAMNAKKILLSAAALICTAAVAFGQGDYASILKLRRANGSISGLRSTADGEKYTFREGRKIVRCSYSDRSQREELLNVEFDWLDYTFSPDEQTLLVAAAEGSQTIYRHSFTADYWLAKVGGTPEKILSSVRDVTFTPDGKALVYAKGNNLYTYDIATRKSMAVTDDGKWNEIINGTTDWVYEEEFGFTQAYAISPDSRQIAYLRFDESRVPVFEMMRYDGTLYNKAFSFKYPKAGDCNSIVELWIYDRTNATKRKVDTGAELDQYISHLGWTPAGELFFFRVNRRQNHFEIVTDNNGVQRVVYDEQAPQYVERKSASDILFVDGERFVMREETSTGYMHLYLHSLKRGRICALTSGKWEVTRIVGCDGRNVWYLHGDGEVVNIGHLQQVVIQIGSLGGVDGDLLQQHLAVVQDIGQTGVVVDDTHAGLILAGEHMDPDVQHQIGQGGFDGDGGLVHKYGQSILLLGGHFGDDLQLPVGIAGHDANGGGGLQTAAAVGVGDHDALDVFDDVAAGLNNHPVGHLAKNLTGLGGAIGHGDGLGAAHGGHQLFVEDLKVSLINQAVTFHVIISVRCR